MCDAWYGRVESVDTLDHNPPPALPPRRPPWRRPSVEKQQEQRGVAVKAGRCAATSSTVATPTAATTTATTTLTTLPFGSTTSSSSSSARVSPQPPPLTPPQYPAPPRPPSRNGGDEARVARARGSGRGAPPSTILANGTPSPRVPPPRAGWAVRITEATLTPSSGASSSASSTDRRAAGPPTTPASVVERWASVDRAPWLDRCPAGTTTIPEGRNFPSSPVSQERHQEEDLEEKKKEEHQHHHRHQRHLEAPLELRHRPMSQGNAIPPLSRPPVASQSITGTPGSPTGFTVANGVVDGVASVASDGGGGEDADAHPSRSRIHDHNRPFPPPRLPVVHNTTTVGRATTVGSFRSRTSLRRPQNVETTENNSRTLLPSTPETTAAPPRSPVGEVSLAVPRPDGERTINEYVEAPFKHSTTHQDRREPVEGKRPGDCPKIDRRHHRHKIPSDATVAPTHRLRGPTGFRGFGAASAAPTTASAIVAASGNAVTKQPVSFTKEPANALGSRGTYDPAGLSIMCDFCGRCRCESCREPPSLPSRWLCDNSCFCSAETVLDYASCLCCVKGMFYHCVDGGNAGGIDGEAGGSCADEPCSCTGNRRVSRWACLGALTLVMPCLLCYWPFKGCVTLCEACYARHAAQGCRCNPGTVSGPDRHHPTGNDLGDSRDPEKRLLDPVTPEL